MPRHQLPRVPNACGPVCAHTMARRLQLTLQVLLPLFVKEGQKGSPGRGSIAFFGV